jgi:hypothetical protein
MIPTISVGDRSNSDALRLRAWPAADTFMPGPQVRQIIDRLQSHQSRGEVDGGERSNVGEGITITGHVLPLFKFAVQARIETMHVGVARGFCFRDLFESTCSHLGNDWSIHPAGTDLGPEFEFEDAIVHLDPAEFIGCATEQIRLWLQRLEISTDGNAFTDVLPVIGFQSRNLAAGVLFQKIRLFVRAAHHVDLDQFHRDAFFRDEDAHAAGIGCIRDVVEFHFGFVFLVCRLRSSGSQQRSASLMSNFVILHHASCASPLHYRIHPDGARERLMPETDDGAYKNTIGIGLTGDCVDLADDHPQLVSLRELLVDIHRRYPAIALGGHRQIRGSNTDCPVAAFPLARIQTWWRGAMLDAHDVWFEDLLAQAYLPKID